MSAATDPTPRTLVLEHHPHGDPGRLLPALARAGVAVDAVRTHLGEEPPTSLSGYAGFVSMGGYMYVSDRARFPFIEIEEELFREAIDRGLPALGICLGAQILASALGAEVGRHRSTQIGWDLVRFDADGDPLTSPLAPESFLFEWHHESFELPPSARLLGGSADVPVQAFRAGSAWGFQFHLEVEERHVREWAASPGAKEELADERLTPERLMALLRERLPAHQARADRVFDAFAQLVRQRPPSLDRSLTASEGPI